MAIIFDKVLDISITIEQGMPVYPGDPPFQHRKVTSLAGGDAAEVSAFDICAHTGTHLDLPSHFIAGQPTLESLPPENFIMPAVLIDNGEGEVVGPEAVANSGAETGEALLIRTTNSHSGVLSAGDFRHDYVYLTPDAAEACVGLGLALVGMDCFCVDRFGNEDYPSHKILLSAGTLILEGIDLAAAEPGHYTLAAIPLKISGAEASPVRAVLLQ